MTVTAWTDQEHAIFLKLYPTGGPKAVHIVTGRPIGSIKVRACQFGIKSDVARRKRGRRYTDEHVVEVLESCGWIAKLAAARLGLHTSTVWAAERRLNEKRKAEVRERNDARRRDIIAYLKEVLA